LREGEPKTNFRVLLTVLCGALISSLLGIADLFMPLSIVVAAGLAGLGIALLVRRGPSRSPLTGPPDAGLEDLTVRCYEIAVRALHDERQSVRTIRNLLGRTEGILESCNRLRISLRQTAEATGEIASATGGNALYRLGDGAGTEPADKSRPLEAMLKQVMCAVRDMAAVLRDVDHNAKDLITSSEETAYSMSRLDAFLQDMANSGRDLESSTDTANRVALEGTKVVEEMGKENEAIITTVNEAASAVEDLGRWSQEVGKIVEVIRDIADETNLLALNASIIAAQSGEHGRAFGVVAEEIRGLAERTSSSTKEISDLVKAVQKNVANVVTSMKKSLQRVERGELLTRNAGTVLEKVFESFESSRNLAKQIASSTFEHKIDSSQVVRSLHKVTNIARRLQAHDYAGWTGAGETLGMARALGALCGTGEVSEGHASSSGSDYGGGIDLHGSRPPEAVGPDLHNLAATNDREIGACIDSLESAKSVLESLLRGTEEACRAGMGVPDMRRGDACPGPFACWRILDCGAELRALCRAYKESDGRVFFSTDAACARAEVLADATPPQGRLSGNRAGEVTRVGQKVGSGQ
jgi:methyl-accepting chemotaxis protein